MDYLHVQADNPWYNYYISLLTLFNALYTVRRPSVAVFILNIGFGFVAILQPRTTSMLEPLCRYQALYDDRRQQN